MKNKKILQIEAVALIIGTLLASGIGATTITNEKTKTDNINEINPVTGDIEYFVLCTISGTYTEEVTNNDTTINIRSDTKSIKVTGTAQVYGSNPGIPNHAFRSVKTDKVQTRCFYGTCSNGKVIGKGFWFVNIGDYESSVKSKSTTPRFFNLIEKIFGNNIIRDI